MVIGIIFALIAALILGSIIIVLYRVFGGQEGKNIDWNQELTYSTNFRYGVILALIGYHVGIHSYLFINTQDYRFPTIGWMIFSFALSALTLVLLWSKRNLLVYSLAIVIALSGLLLPFRANGFVQSVNIAMSMITTLIAIYLLTRPTPIWTISKIIQESLLYIPLTIIQTVRLFKSFVRPSSIKQHSFLGWFKTLIITFIVLFFFIALLSNADPVFSQIIKEFREQLLGRTLASVIILIILSALLSIIRPHMHEESAEKTTEWISYRDVYAVSIAVVAILGIFLFVQFKYLFGGSQELLVNLNLTYSEYVRKGFIELLIATFAGGCISYLFTLKSRGQSEGKHTLSTALNAILIAQLVFLLISAIKRDLLYVDTYGLTRVRIVGGLFLLWLFGFLSTLAFFTFKKNMREVRILLTMWILSIIVWGTLNIVNIDRVVAQGAPAHHEYTDYFYLTQLSEDASFQWTTLPPQMERDARLLLQKESLSEVDASQLAGIKLGLITFIEKRDRLYRYYAPSEWLLTNGWKIGDQFEKSVFNSDQYSGSSYYHDDIISTISDSSWNDKTKERELPETLIKQRSWPYLNLSEQNAYASIATNETYYFDQINQLVTDIRTYQVKKQISLWEHENRLLYELKYPFISVTLQRYRPEDYTRRYIESTQNQDLFVAIESEQEWSVPKLYPVTCAETLPQELTAIGVLNRSSTIVSPQGTPTYYMGTLSSISTTQNAQIPLKILSTLTLLQPKMNTEVGMEMYPTNSGSREKEVVINNTKMQTAPLNSNEQIIVNATVKPVKTNTNATCTYEYEVIKIVEVMDLMQR